MPLFDPPVGFHFLVRFEGLLLNPKYIGIPDLGFKEVSGINADISTEEYHEGGENRFKHRLPQPATYQNLGHETWTPHRVPVDAMVQESTENFSFEPSDITVVLLNGDHIPLQAWNFIQAYPVKWQIAELNATDAQILIETVEFSYQYFRRIDPTDLLPF